MQVGGFDVAYSGKKKALPGVNSALVYQLWEVALKSPVVSSILELTSVWATASPWHLEIELRDEYTPQGEKKRQAEGKRSYTDNQLNQILSEQMQKQLEIAIKHTIIFGFFVIRYRLSDRVPAGQATAADVEPVVLHPHEYELRYTIRKDGRRKWFAFERGNMFGSTQSKPIPYSRVFIHELPEPFTGRPNSPLMRCLRTVYQYDSLMANMEIVGNKKAFPPFIFQNKSEMLQLPTEEQHLLTKQAQMQGQQWGIQDGDGDLIAIETEQANLLSQIQLRRNSIVQARQVYEKASQFDNLPSQLDTLSPHNKDYIDDYVETARANPTLPSKLLPNGIELDPHLPKAETLNEFSEIEEILKTQIAVLLGVPVEFIFPQRGRFSADILLSKKVMSIRNTKMHRWIAEILERVFLDIHYEYVFKMIENLSKKLAVESMDAVSAIIGHDAFVKMGMMLKEKYFRAIKNSILVNVHFDENTAATPESLLLAFKTSVIDHDTYSQLMLSTLGLAHSLKAEIPDKKRKEIEEQLRGETQLETQKQQPAAKRQKQSSEPSLETMEKQQKE